MDDRAQGLAFMESLFPVSRESVEKFNHYEAVLKKWQRVQNLVASKTLDSVWLRHFADSAQILSLAPKARHWVDLGSGAGFPGLVIAILLDQAGEDYCVHLIESNGRKTSFLQTVSRELGLKTQVHNGRIENVLEGWLAPVDAFSARALSNFDKLCEMVYPFLGKDSEQNAVAVFHKGRDFDTELTEASVRWTPDLVQKASMTDPEASLVLLRGLSLKSA